MKKTSLYLHIPFCTRKCLYCSFVVNVAQEQRRDVYIDALINELKTYPKQKLSSLYLGGGTPSLLTNKQLEKLLTFVYAHFTFDEAAEKTIEVNPENIDTKKAKLLKDLGVNRISLGVQSFNDDVLKHLGRCHDAQVAHQSYELLRKVGFNNISLDLMYCFPKQNKEDIELDIKQAASLNPNHISMYALTIEEHSRFHAKQVSLDDSQILKDHYLTVVNTLNDYGFKQYEVSNFAKNAQVSKHNMHYWQGDDYIGVGIGAHSLVNSYRINNIDNLFDYLKCMDEGKSVIQQKQLVVANQYLTDLLLFGLRMNEGVNLEDIESKAKIKLTDDQYQMINWLVDEKLLAKQENVVKTTQAGRLMLDEIAVKLID